MSAGVLKYTAASSIAQCSAPMNEMYTIQHIYF
jgi:hypothetical protein